MTTTPPPLPDPLGEQVPAEWAHHLVTVQNLLELHAGLPAEQKSQTLLTVTNLLTPMMGNAEHAAQLARRAARTTDRTHAAWLVELIRTMQREWAQQLAAQVAKGAIDLPRDRQVAVGEDPLGTVYLSVSDGGGTYDPHAQVDLTPPQARAVALALLSQPCMAQQATIVAATVLGSDAVREHLRRADVAEAEAARREDMPLVDLVMHHESFVASWPHAETGIRVYAGPDEWGSDSKTIDYLTVAPGTPHTPAAMLRLVTAWFDANHDRI